MTRRLSAISLTRRVVLLAAAAAIVLIVGVVAAARELNVRDLLGANGAGYACHPRRKDVRFPHGVQSPSGRWRELPNFPIAQDELRAAAVAPLVYVGSGLEERRPGAGLTSTNVFFAFDPRRSTYRRLPPLPRRVDHPALVALRGDLYLIGGWHDNVPTADAFRYSPRTGDWTQLAPMPTPRGSPTAAAIEQRIYVAGGSPTVHVTGNPRSTGLLEIFDITTGRWSRGPSMPTPRHHAGAAAVRGNIYVVGGRGQGDWSLATVERFSPQDGDWRRVAPLPMAAGGLEVVAADGKVVAIGGGDDDKEWVTPATWSLDPSRGTWERLADLNVPRHGFAAAALNGSAFVFGGAPCPDYGLTDAAESLRLPASE